MNTLLFTPPSQTTISIAELERKRLKQQANGKMPVANPQALATQTQTTDTLAGMPYHQPLPRVLSSQNRDGVSDFGIGSAVSHGLNWFTTSKFGRNIGKAADKLLNGFFFKEEEENALKGVDALFSEAQQKFFQENRVQTDLFRQSLADSAIVSSDIRADLITQWVKELTQSNSATLDGIIEHRENRDRWFKASVSSLFNLDGEFVHVGHGGTWPELKKMLKAIKNTKPHVFDQQDEAGEKARELLVNAHMELASMDNNQTSPFFRW